MGSPRCEHPRMSSLAEPTTPTPTDPDRPRYRIEAMTLEDVPEVARVERRSFTNPWPTSAYRRELGNPQQNHYIVLRSAEPSRGQEDADSSSARSFGRRTFLPLGFGRRGGEEAAAKASPILGFAGMWNAFDEAHVTTIAVDEPYRGAGLGELLLAALFDEAGRRGANWLTLEVRVSNDPAIALYTKWGFTIQGTRKRYYSDNNEDAHVMWSKAISDPVYRHDLAILRHRLLQRIGGPVEGFPTEQPAHQIVETSGQPPWGSGG